MELDTKQKEKTNAAKVFYTLSRQGVPILDLELRYKGDFKSMPQFFATITQDFQDQISKSPDKIAGTFDEINSAIMNIIKSKQDKQKFNVACKISRS